VIIALHLIGLACLFWRWSLRTDDRLVATVRWCLAVFTLLLGVAWGLGAWLG